MSDADVRYLTSYIVWFFIYSFIGWIYESSLRSFTHRSWYNSGFLNGPYIPIYGFGAIFDIYLLSGIKDPIKIFLLAGTIDCILEYLTSFAMEKIFHGRWWDYSNKPFNINGRVCLLGYLAFGAFATVIVKWFHPFLKRNTTALIHTNDLIFLSVLIIGLMSLDTFMTIKGLSDLKDRLAGFEKMLEEFKIKASSKLTDSPLMNKIASFYEQLNDQQKRLLRAFPNLHFESHKHRAEEYLALIRQAIDRRR